MLLDLSKALSFFTCIVVVYRAAIDALFAPASKWEERVAAALLRLALAACVCGLSGIVFAWPTRTNPDRGMALSGTLPVRFFYWSSAAIGLLFLSSWFMGDLVQQAAPFISNRALQPF